jgi:hypothetical protein
MIAKEVMPGKFWILEDGQGLKKGTISAAMDGRISATVDGQASVYSDWTSMAAALDLNAAKAKAAKEEAAPSEVHGYPTNCEPFNAVWDVQKKLPLFTKTDKSKSLHAAGYYIVKFDHGWVHSFCPKLSTLTSNEWQGPFKSKLEMRERLRLADD